MALQIPEPGTNPRRSAIIIWAAMSLGPAIFLVTLISIGVWLLGVDRGWWVDPASPPSDWLLFGPVVAVILAELAGAGVASMNRGKLSGTLFESHAISAIRTTRMMILGFGAAVCLTGLLLFVPNMNAIGAGLGAIFIMAFALPMLFIWKTFRVVRGLRRAMDGKAIADHPTRWS